jgi:hypothetical protein
MSDGGPTLVPNDTPPEQGGGFTPAPADPPPAPPTPPPIPVFKPGVRTPTKLEYRDLITVNMDQNNDVNIADVDNYGHRIQIPVGRSLFNLYFRWRREIGQDRPRAKLTTSQIIEKTFKTVLIDGFNTSVVDIDGVSGGLHFGTANLSLNTDPRLRKDGLVSANDIPMAFIMYKLYGNSAFQTKGFILNLEDAYDMLTSEGLVNAIMNSFKANEGTALDMMFRDLLAQDPKRFFNSNGVSDPRIFENSTDEAGEGSWKLSTNDIIEIKTKIIFHSKITKRGVGGREHLLSNTNSAENQQDIIVPDDFFYVRLQLKVFDDGIIVDPTNLTYSDSTQTVVTGYTGTINGEVVIPAGVTSIAANAFMNQTGLTAIMIPQSVTSIGIEAFKNTGITSIFMPNVTTIGARSFENCANLTTVIAPNLTTIGDDAFAGCISYVSQNSFSIIQGFADVNSTQNTTSIQTQDVINLTGVTALGAGAFSGCQSIETIIIPPTITEIPPRLLSGAVSLTSVTIPPTVTTIGASALAGTTSLETVVIPTSVTTIENAAFSGAGITSITLHSGITTIGQSVFANAAALEEVVILAPITTLPAGIFNGASSLTTVDLPITITTVATEAFKGTAIVEIELPNVTNIQANAFANIPTLQVVEAPSVQVVSNTAFAGVATLQEAPADPSSIVFSDSTNTVVTGYTGSVGTLKLPATVTAIADNAFMNNMNVIGLSILAPIQTIGTNAFKGSGIRTINLPAGLTSLGNSAFENCVNLTTVTLPTGAITLGNYCFSGCSALTSVNITTDITSIPIYCFNGCSNLPSINLHSGITSIGTYAFNGCASLASVTIPPAINTLAPYTFAGCAALTSITLPLTLTNYQTACFSGSGLTSITFPELTTTNIGDQVLANCTGLTSVTFPNKPPSGGSFPLTLGTAILMGCTGLQSFTVPDQWLSLPNNFFEGSGLTSITVPSTITTLGTSLFKGCLSLTTATIESAITTLPSATFQNCTALTSVTLPSTVTTIDTQAFRNSRITAFVNSIVTTIRDFAFADNPALVTLNAPNVTSLAISSISGASNLGDINVSALPSARVYFRAITYSGSGTWTNIGSLGSTHNATIASGTPTKNSTGNGVVFNGGLRYTFPSLGTIPVYSMSVWLRRTTTARTIVGQQNWSSGNIGAGIYADWRRSFYGGFNRSNIWYNGPSTEVDAAKWTHIVVTYDASGNMTMYKDGAFINRSTWSGVVHTDNGSHYNFGPDFRGEIGEFRFYNMALNADQVQFLYIFTANSFPNPAQTSTDLLVHLTASTYSGSGAWTNTGILGSSHNAVVNSGTPTKNAAGNGIVFNANLSFRFPTVGPLTNYTQSVWFKRTGQAGWLMAQHYDNQGHNAGPCITGYRRGFNAVMRTSYSDWSGGAQDTNLNQWYNLTIVYDNFVMYTYLNGGLTDRRRHTNRYVESTENDYYIGVNWQGQNGFIGEIGEVRFYNGALTAAQVLTMYNSTANYTNTPIPNQMWLQYTASTYSGSGAWTNTGTLGTAFNATVRSGTPSKNTVGDGIVFKRNLSYQFPNMGMYTQYAYSIWFKRTGQSGWIMAQHYDGNTHQVGFYISADARRHFSPRSRTAYVDWGIGSVETDQNVWCNMIVSYNGTTMQVYRNGVLIESGSVAGRFTEPNGNVYYIGANWEGWNTFDGEIGEFRFYSGPLTSTEATAIYTSTVGNYTNTPIPEDMRICLTASTYSGTGAWTNTGTLGTAFNATVRSGTPSKNADGNGIVFRRNLSFQIPNIGMYTKYTFAGWIKRTGLSGWFIGQQYDGSSHQVGFGISNNNGRFFYPRHRTAYADWGNGSWETNPNTWHHLVSTYDGSTYSVYLDGVLTEQAVNVNRFIEPNFNVYFIGADWDGNNRFHGEIGEIRFYTAALTSAQVTELYNSTVATYPNPAPTTQMLLQYTGSTYSGSGAWTNTGTLGTSHNAVVNSGTPSKNGNAVVFSNLVYRIPNMGPLPRHTFSIWLMRTGVARWVFGQQYDYGTHQVGPNMMADGNRSFFMRFRYHHSDHSVGSVDTDINTWYHIAATFDGTRMAHYLNGVLVGGGNILGQFVEPNDNQYFLGTTWENNSPFIGRIGEFRLYNGALSAEEVKAIYDATFSSYITPTIPPTPTVNMLVQFTASTYSGSGNWTNTGTLGATHNAEIHTGTPSKNSAGNGIVFRRNLIFRFPSVGALTSYTQIFWIKRQATAGTIISQRHENTGNILGTVKNNYLRGFFPSFFRNWAWYDGTTVDTDPDIWYHLAFTWSGTQFRSYLNGVLQSTSGTITGITSTDNGRIWNIGGNWDTTSTFFGEIGEVRVYSGAMNDTQIKETYDTTVANYPNTPVPGELRVHYRATDYSGSGAWTNQGTLGATHNGALQAGTPTKNAAGNGVIFNGAVRFGFPSLGTIPSYTQSLWIKRTGWAGTIMSQQNNGSNAWMAVIEGANGRAFYPRFLYNGGWPGGPSADTDPNVWYHITFTWGSGEWRVYVNGVLRSRSLSLGWFSEDTGAQYFLGAQWDGWSTFVGEIGEFRFYNYALSASEVAQVYNSTVATFPQTPPPATELRVHYVGSNYSGTGAWTNQGTLGATHNGALQSGTPAKNTEGNGVVFNGGVRFGFPDIGVIINYTQSLWVKRTGWAGMIISQQNNGRNTWMGMIDGANGRAFYARFYYNGGWYGGGSVDTDINRWYHMTFVWNGSQYLTYVDGVLQNISLNYGFTETNGAQYFLGANWDGWGSFVGEIGEFRFYNGALSPQQVAQIYTSTVANYTQPSPLPTEMLIRFNASSYSGSGDWTNTGTLGSAQNAVVHSGTPRKNTAGNGVVFNTDLVFRFPNFGNTPNYTISIWLKRMGHARPLLCQQNNGRNTWMHYIDGSIPRGFESKFYWMGGWYGSAALDTDQDHWYNLTFVYVGGQTRCYVDGILNFITNTGGQAENNGAQYFLGSNWEGWAWFIGELGELRIYRGAVTDQGVLDIYNETLANYPNPTPVTQLLIHYTGTNYSGSGAWTNIGTLGTTHNATVGQGTPSKSGNGVVFNGGLRFNIPHFGPMSRYTQALWIRRANTSLGVVMSQQNVWSQYIAGGIHGNGSTGLYGAIQWYNGWHTSSTAVLANTNTWYHVTIVWNGTQFLTYLNGDLQGIITHGTISEQNWGQYFLGGNWDGTPTFNGQIGELRIYNGPLDGTQVRELYNSTASTFV